MKCPHCQVNIHADWKHAEIKTDETPQRIILKFMACPSCKNIILEFLIKSPDPLEGRSPCRYVAAPRFPNLPSADNEVPESLREDYREACAVLSINAKASAALSRRILQTVLKEQGYSSDNLATQIENVLKEQNSRNALPSALHTTVDAIRNFGNFSAHPLTDKTSLQIIDVEPEEAEWCLNIIGDCSIITMCNLHWLRREKQNWTPSLRRRARLRASRSRRGRGRTCRPAVPARPDRRRTQRRYPDFG